MAGSSYPKGAAMKWAEQAPPARYPEVVRVHLSASVPQWAHPRRVLNFDLSAEYDVPPPLVRTYPFPHGITMKCRLPFPSQLEIEYRPKQEGDARTVKLRELEFYAERTTRMQKEGYFMVQWGRMAPDWNGVLVADCLVSVVPPTSWRGRKEPGPNGSEGLEFFLTNVSINPRYYDKKYQGPPLARSTPYLFTVTMTGP